MADHHAETVCPRCDELLMKIQELESIIWDGTRQVADLEAGLQQAYECCARPSGICFDPALITQFDGSGDSDG